MTMPNTFQEGTDYEQESFPMLVRTVHESDCWPVDTRSGSGSKDQLAIGLHPVVALGGRTVADGRPLNPVGIVLSYSGAGAGNANDQVRVNVARFYACRQYVANVLTYANDIPATFEQAPIPFQPVYVDDSNDLSEGVTLSMSPLNDADVANPHAGWLIYCQDEMADAQWGGARAAPTFDTILANELVEQEFCVLLSGGGWQG